jgi:hypothetical protein
MLFSSLRRWFAGPSKPAQASVRERKPRFEVLEDRVVPTWTINDLTTTTALAMAQSLVGVGVTVSNIQYTGAPKAAGIFNDSSSVTGIKGGVILSSGSAKGVAGPVVKPGANQGPGQNNSPSFSTTNGTPGDAQLNAISGSPGFDASILQFDFVPKGNLLSFSYVFGSEEYPEFVGSINDVFAFFLNGKNVALVPGTSSAVSIDNVSPITNSKFYVDNFTNPSGPIYGTHNTQMDGYTTVLPVTATVVPGNRYHIKLAIEDASDTIYDSWVLIKAGSLSAPHIGVYGPLRYTYQATTGLYSGVFTAWDYSSASLTGPLYLVFTNLPSGVTVANASGKTGHGYAYIRLPGNTLPAHGSLHVTVSFKNPKNVNLGTSFMHLPVGIAGNLQ